MKSRTLLAFLILSFSLFPTLSQAKLLEFEGRMLQISFKFQDANEARLNSHFRRSTDHRFRNITFVRVVNGTVELQRLTTTLYSPIEEWVLVGGEAAPAVFRRYSTLHSTTNTRVQRSKVWVRVDVL